MSARLPTFVRHLKQKECTRERVDLISLRNGYEELIEKLKGAPLLEQSQIEFRIKFAREFMNDVAQWPREASTRGSKTTDIRFRDVVYGRKFGAGRLIAVGTHACTVLDPSDDVNEFSSYSVAQPQGGKAKKKRKKDLVGCPREVRQAACKTFARDFDIVNCQPTLLLQLATRLNIELAPGGGFPNLRRYVNNRKGVISEQAAHYGVIDTDDAGGGGGGGGVAKEAVKNMLIRVMFRGNLSNWRADWGIPEKICDSPFVTGINSELGEIMDRVMKSPECEGFVDDMLILKAKEKGIVKTDIRVRRSVWAILLQTLEDFVLSQIVDYLRQNNVEIVSLQYDGVLAFGSVFNADPKSVEKLLRGAEDYTKEKTGFSIQLLEKPFYDGSC